MNASSARPLALALVAAAATLVATATPTPAAAQTGAQPIQLRVATGKAGKGFSRVFADIRGVCGNVVPMVEVETEGGLQNLTVLAANKADVGFVQLDTLASMRDSDPAIAALQPVMPLNSNLLHIVARAGGFEAPRNGLLDRLGGRKVVVVRAASELKGLPVAVVGSARALGRELDRQHGLGLQFVDVASDEAGLAALRRGEVAALFSTAGWPSGPVQALKRGDGWHLVRFDLKATEPYQVTSRNYENLDTFKHPFLAAPNLLVSRAFSPTGAYGRAVKALDDCVRRNLTTLREGPYEPAWQEVRLETPVADARRTAPASK